MLTPSGDAWMTSTVAPSAAQCGGRGAERGAVAAVEHDVQAGELATLERVDERRDVVVECGAVLARHTDPEARGPRLGLGDRERAQLLLDLALEHLGDLAATAGEQLDAVVAERVVAGGDDRTGRTALTRRVGDAGCGEHAHQEDVGTLGAETGDQRRLEHGARTTRVAAHHEGLLAAEHPRRGAAERGHELGGELDVGDAPHPVGAESQRHVWPMSKCWARLSASSTAAPCGPS